MSEYPISPSQYKTAFDPETGCLRKWAFYKIEGIKSDTTAAQQLGTNTHEQAENYLRDGTPPDLKTKPGKIFASGMHLLPRRELVTGVEQEFYLKFDHELTFYGLIDFMGADFVGDHKTTSNFDYMLTPSQLETDPQGVFYGMYLASVRKTGLTDPLTLMWIYYLTRGPREARKVEKKTTRVQLERAYFPMAENAKRLVELRQTADRALDIEPNYNACGAFGGCPHISKCEKKNKQLVYGTGTTEIQTMSSLLERLQAKKHKAQNPEPKPDLEEVNPRPRQAQVVSINPPHAEPESQIETEPEDNGPSDAEIDEGIVEQKVAEFYEKPKPKATTKRRGRPKGSKNKPKPEPEAKPIAEVMADDWSGTAPEPTTVEYASCDSVPASQTETGYTLYINCMPSSGGVDITATLSQIATKCAADNDVEHYRFIRFGEAKARFSKSVTEALRDQPLGGKIVVDSMNLMVADCLEVLIEQASEVVRAIK